MIQTIKMVLILENMVKYLLHCYLSVFSCRNFGCTASILTRLMTSNKDLTDALMVFNLAVA